MCVIIHKPAETTFNEADIRAAHSNNEDGFGYMYYDPKLKKVVAEKAINQTPDTIVETFKNLEKYNACFHYRYKTHGEIVNAQCHPFRVLNRKDHGVDMFMMHNGVISEAGIKAKESDTQAFTRNFLQPILAKAPSLIHTEAMQKLISKYIGQGSKLCFMLDDGTVVKINESKGSQRDGCWVSNTYSFTEGHRIKKTYTHNTKTNYSGKSGRNTKKNAAGGGSSSVVPYSRYKANNVQKGSVEFFGQKVSRGDPIYVFDNTDPNFAGMGEVKTISNTSLQAVFKNREGATLYPYFDPKDGSSLAFGRRYSVFPAGCWVDEDKDSVLDLKGTVGSDKASQTQKKGIVLFKKKAS